MMFLIILHLPILPLTLLDTSQNACPDWQAFWEVSEELWTDIKAITDTTNENMMSATHTVLHSSFTYSKLY
jgi:hypothetical protein